MSQSGSGELHPESIAVALTHAVAPLLNDGRPAVVVVSTSSARRSLRDAVAPFDASIVVLSQQEIVSEVDLEIVGTIDVVSRAS
jgi:flagellar biosynthesis component FlhA